YRRPEMLAARLAGPAQAPQVMREPAVADELGERRLLEPWLAIVEQGLGRQRRLEQLFRNDHVAEAKPGAEALREGPEIDDMVLAVLALEGGQWRAAVVEVAVVVVLDEIGAASMAPFEERLASVERQGRSERVLVRRRDVRERGRRGQRRRVDAVGIDGYGTQVRAMAGEHAARAAIAGVLHHHVSARSYQQLREQAEPFLYAVRDDDARWVAGDAARSADVLRDGGAQGGQSLGIAVAAELFARRAQHLHEQAAPRADREETRIDLADPEVVGERTLGTEDPMAVRFELQPSGKKRAIGADRPVGLGQGLSRSLGVHARCD